MLTLFIRILIIGVALAMVVVPLVRTLRRMFGPPSKARVWIAREGLVEESPQAVLLFPWSEVSSFDKTELHGRAAIRIWLNEDPESQFRLLNLRVPSDQRDAWVSARARELERSRYWTSAQLVLRQVNMDQPMESFFGQLRRLAEDPRSSESLPSVLDDPQPLDLDALGIGAPPEDG